MAKTKTKSIGGHAFEASTLDYFAAQDLLSRILRLAGPALTTLLTLAGATNGRVALAAIGDMEIDKIAPMLAAFFEKLQPDEVQAISREILVNTRVRVGGKILPFLEVIDAVLDGDFWTGLAVQAFALSVHFGNFSGARAAFDAAGLTPKASPSSASTTSPAESD